jgi:hypothetical protein
MCLALPVTPTLVGCPCLVQPLDLPFCSHVTFLCHITSMPLAPKRPCIPSSLPVSPIASTSSAPSTSAIWVPSQQSHEVAATKGRPPNPAGEELTRAFPYPENQLMQMWKVGETSSPPLNGKSRKDKHRGDYRSFLTKIVSIRRLHGKSSQCLHVHSNRRISSMSSINLMT